MFALLAAIRAEPPAAATPAAVPSPTPPMIRDVAPPVDYLSYPLWEVVLVSFLAAVLLGLILFHAVRWARRKPMPMPPRPRVVALGELEQLRAQTHTLEPYAFSIAVSHVLRRYVEGQYQVPALEQTSPEFLGFIAHHRGFSKGDRQLLSDFLEVCDAIKFGRAAADFSVNETLLARSISFVQGGFG